MNTKPEMYIEPENSTDAALNAESPTSATAVEQSEVMDPQWLRRRLSERDRPEHPSLDRTVRQRVISGNDLRLVRERCGYVAEEFAEFLRKQDAPINSARSVSRLEQQQHVPLRYVKALERMVGVENFQQSIREVVLREEYAVWDRKRMKARAYVAQHRAKQMAQGKEPAKQQATSKRGTPAQPATKQRS